MNQDAIKQCTPNTDDALSTYLILTCHSESLSLLFPNENSWKELLKKGPNSHISFLKPHDTSLE